MSEAAPAFDPNAMAASHVPPAAVPGAVEAPTAKPTVAGIFGAFLLIGATSFGGGVVAYLRSSLVTKHKWVDDKTFVELLAISQTLPGLNATNMAILVGDRLRGLPGAIAAVIGICLPGALLMYLVGMVYHEHGDRPLVTAALKGVAAAAVGLILATTVQLSKKSLAHVYDLVFIALTVIGVNRLHQRVPRVLVVVGILAILWYRPRKKVEEGSSQ
ncbi:MAG: chromate transporter [Acidobacteriaceae bacterium]|nr:chromate transporter [Acidobacteriaceae bacterium]